MMKIRRKWMILGRSLRAGPLVATLLMAGLWAMSHSAVQAAPQATYTVTNTADSGAGSLRQAVLDANGNPGADIINFNAGLSGQTITLTSGEIVINDGVSIDGSSLGSPVTIDGGSNNGRMFYIDATGSNITINGLRFINGDSNTGDPGDWDGDGGAIYVLNSSSTTITASEFADNQSEFNGGAIYIYFGAGIVELTNNTFTNNSTLYAGGAVRTVSDQAVTLSGNTFVGNTANEGGAIWASGAGGETVVNNTFANNNGTNTLYHYETLYLTNNTFLGNDGVTVRSASAFLHMHNNIIGSCSVFGGTIATNVNNWIINGSCSPAYSGNPYLMPLDDNGGPTQTAAPLPSSGVIGAGNSTYCPATDQRGVSRAATCDLGAFEVQTADYQSVCRSGFTGGDTLTFASTGIAITVDTVGSLSDLCVTLTESNHPNATTGLQTGLYWSVNETAASSDWSLTMSAPVDFTLDGDDKLCRYPGGLGGAGWDCAVTSIDNTNSRITRSGITQLSDWVVGNNAGPTAVTVQSATADSASAPWLPVTVVTLLLLLTGTAVRLWRDEL